MKRPEHIRYILKSNNALNRLARQIERHKILEHQIKHHLPESLQDIRVSNLSSEGHLTLSCQTSSQATLLRYQLPLLEKNLKNIDSEIKKITIKTHPR